MFSTLFSHCYPFLSVQYTNLGAQDSFSCYFKRTALNMSHIMHFAPAVDCTPLAPTRSRSRTITAGKARWTSEEDALLSQLVKQGTDWPTITSCFPGRTNKQVLAHWKKVANPNIVRGSWTLHEDQTIIHWVEVNGPSQWATLAAQMPGRIAKQCRERWCNHLDPAIKKTSWTPEEDQIIVNTIKRIGTRWADIARLLPGRTDNAVKNRWNSTLRRQSVTIENHHLEIPETKLEISSVLDSGHLLSVLLSRTQALKRVE